MDMLAPLLVIFAIVATVRGDTIANCTFDDVAGHWTFLETERSGSPSIDCNRLGPIIHEVTLTLEYPNVATDQFGNQGFWTMIYNQGFEVRISGRSYFAFSYYKEETNLVLCNETMNGWSRDVTIRNWACFRGRKAEEVAPKYSGRPLDTERGERPFKYDRSFVKKINAKQNSWKATYYHDYEKMTLNDLHRRAGGRASVVPSRPSRKRATLIDRILSSFLPESFDWRNASGVDYVSPVRDQEKCGSCYAFASMAGLESRVRILTDNTQRPVFSPQDVIGCTPLAQGCNGGFPYLIAGRYAQDVGVVLDACNPYTADDSTCITEKSCKRHYTASYNYVGGYFGGCNEELMKLALVRGGPLIVGFEVYDDFLHYESGIYHHTGLMDKFNPLELTNHAVLLVGYGKDASGEKFWAVKNSWGTSWGEAGFFRIRRGSDECGVESMALEVVPIP